MELISIEILWKPNIFILISFIISFTVSLLIIIFLTTLFLDGKQAAVILLVGIMSISCLAYCANIGDKYINIHIVADTNTVRDLEANDWKIIENSGNFYILEKQIQGE